MSTGGSSLCLSRLRSPSYDDCDLPELQCACGEPVVQEISYTEYFRSICLMRCNMLEVICLLCSYAIHAVSVLKFIWKYYTLNFSKCSVAVC
jgi:hypothetical protein